MHKLVLQYQFPIENKETVSLQVQFSEMVQQAVDNETRRRWLKLKCSRVQPGMTWADTELRVRGQWPEKLEHWPVGARCHVPFTSADIPDSLYNYKTNLSC